MTFRPSGHLMLLALLPLLASATPALAQFSGAIQGTIVDSQKAVVGDAIVTVTHTESGVTRESITTSHDYGVWSDETPTLIRSSKGGFLHGFGLTPEYCPTSWQFH